MRRGSCIYFGPAVNVTRSPVSHKNSAAFCVGSDSFMFPERELQYGAYDDERRRILSAWSACMSSVKPAHLQNDESHLNKWLEFPFFFSFFSFLRPGK